MTCKECVHYEVCAEQEAMLGEKEIDKIKGVEKHCEYFKPKSRYVELPCEVGQKIYRLSPKGEIWEWQIAVIEIYPDEIALVDDSDNYIKPEEIGKTVFLSREEAENALPRKEDGSNG